MRVGQSSFTFFVSKMLASLATFLAMVYFARFLGAEVLGTYFLVLAVVTWLQLIGTLGIAQAVTKRASESTGEGEEYVVAGFILGGGVVAILVVIVYSLRTYLETYIGAPVVEFLIILLILNVLFRFVASVLRAEHKVHLYAITDTTGKFIRTLTQIGTVFLGFGLVGLLSGYAIGSLALVIIGLYLVSSGISIPGPRHFTGILSYAKYSWLGSFQNKTFSWMDTIILGFFVSNSLIGIYEIAWNLASFMAVFGIAISQTLFPEMSKLTSEGRLDEVKEYFQDSLKYSGLFLIPGFVGSLILGEQILSIYGAEFTQGVWVLYLLIFARLVYSYQHQFVNTLNSMDYPELAFRVNTVFVSGNVALNVALVYRYGWVGAAFATLLSAGIALFVGHHYLAQILHFEIPNRMIGKQLLSASVMAGSLLGITKVVGSVAGIEITIWAAVPLVFVGATIYFIALYILSAEFRATVENNLPVHHL